MKNQAFWLDVLINNRPGYHFDLLRTMLGGLSNLYDIGLEHYLNAEAIGIRRRLRMPVPVISVGNLTSGGTGKTPVTEFLASGLICAGQKPLILSRGHGGSRSKYPAMVSDASGDIHLNAAQAGDESVAMAKHLPGVPVYIGKDRRQSAREAFRKFSPDLLVLDDGLQYWQLVRDLDIVLIDARCPFSNGYTLPRGLLRERKEHINRAGIVIITRSDRVSLAENQALKAEISALAPKASIYFSNHVFAGWRRLNKSGQLLPSGKALAVCGIAQPESFLDIIRKSDISLVTRPITLDDHAAYSTRSVAAFVSKAKQAGAECIVTTEKDAVKFEEFNIDFPCYAAKVKITIDSEQDFWRDLFERLSVPIPTKLA